MTTRLGFGLSCLLGVTALLLSPRAGAQPGSQIAPPLPMPMGEIMGAVVGDKFYVMAGLDTATHKPIGAVYAFDPVTGEWTQKKSMPQPAHHVMVAALNGKIYVFGGFVSPTGNGEETGWQPTDQSWTYEPGTDTWEAVANLPTPRGVGWAVESNGKLFVIGGVQANVRENPTAPLSAGSPQRVLGTVEEYDPATRQWNARAPMPTPRNHLIAAEVGGKIYAIGGRLGSTQITVADDTNIVEEYDPAADQWADKGRAPIRRSGMIGDAFNGKIYVAGGEFQDWEGAKAYWAVQSFDPATGRWDNLPRMQLAHHGFAAGFIGNNLHVAGGGFQSDGMPGVNTKTAVHELLSIDR